MFIGMIGFSVWHSRSSVPPTLTYPSMLANWYGQNHFWVRVLAALISVIFLGIYAAAQFSAGSKALHVLFGWEQRLGVVLGAGMVLFYCFSGGLRASVWTDTAQSMVMLTGMLIMVWITVSRFGGIDGSLEALNGVSATFMNWFPPDLAFGAAGPALFVIGWMFAGFGVIGQPHIMVRFMSLDSEDSMQRARIYYYPWYISFYTLALVVDLMSRLILPEIASFDVAEDTELALPTLAAELLPGLLAGLVLAGLFAATISTADSLILSCSAAISQDLLPKRWQSFGLTRLVTLGMIVLALTIALISDESVFILVLYAWSGLGAAFAPLLLAYTLGRRPAQPEDQ